MTLRSFPNELSRAGALPWVLLLALAGAPAHADGLADLRAALARLDSRSAIRAELEVESSERYGTGGSAIAKWGQVELQVEADEHGLQLTLGPDALARMEAEDAARVHDSRAPAPTRQAAARVDASAVRRMLSAASRLGHQLDDARFTGERAEAWRGRPARVLSFALPVTTLEEEQRKYVHSFEGTLQVWIAPDGTPLASAARLHLEGRAFVLVGFVRDDVDDSLYAVVGDRLVATYGETASVGSGAGERAEVRVVRILTPQ